MIKNPQILAAFDRQSMIEETMSLEKKYALLDGMYELARSAGALEKSTSLEDLTDDIEIARILHKNVQKTSR